MYTQELVCDMITRQHHGLRELAQSVGQSEGTVQSQHEAAIQFWSVALALDGRNALSAADRAFADAEIARHTRALDALKPKPGRGRMGGEAV
jgi:hypothetical protein